MYCPHFKLEDRQCNGTCSNCPYGFIPFSSEKELKNVYIVMKHVDYEFDEIYGVFDTLNAANECKIKNEKIETFARWEILTWKLNSEINEQ